MSRKNINNNFDDSLFSLPDELEETDDDDIDESFTSPSSVSIASVKKKRGLSKKVKKEVVKQILSPDGLEQSKTRFDNSALFGSVYSKERKKAYNSRERLIQKKKKDPEAFASICQELGLEDKLQQEEPKDETENVQTKMAHHFKTSPKGKFDT